MRKLKIIAFTSLISLRVRIHRLAFITFDTVIIFIHHVHGKYIWIDAIERIRVSLLLDNSLDIYISNKLSIIMVNISRKFELDIRIRNVTSLYCTQRII